MPDEKDNKPAANANADARPQPNAGTMKEDPRGKADPETGGANLVSEQMEAEMEVGYRGYTPDPTPNENYTLQGVGKGAPTPETDDELGDKARSIVTRNQRRSAAGDLGPPDKG